MHEVLSKAGKVDIETVGRETGVQDIRAGKASDAVLGQVPTVVASAGSVEEVSRLLAWANSQGLKVVPCGSRTKLDRGAAPSGCDIMLDLSPMSSIIEHASGDLTVTVQAGVRLVDLQQALAGSRQFLAVDPPVPGTMGGLIATNDSGPRRLRYGGLRDLILGVKFVRADGVVAKGGGRVVKNVAGYDLPKLFTGSLGTLGVIVEATFRLYPLPEASATVVVEGVSALQTQAAVTAILGSQLVPTSLDYFSEGPEKSALAVRFESSPRSVEAQVEQAIKLLGNLGTEGGKPLEPAVARDGKESRLWSRFDRVTHKAAGDVLVRLISTPSDLPGLVDAAQRDSENVGLPLTVRAHSSYGHALLRWSAPEPGAVLSLLMVLRSRAEALGHNMVIWRAPSEVRQAIDVWGDTGEGLDLMRRIKAQFDPRNTLNPGRFVGGI